MEEEGSMDDALVKVIGNKVLHDTMDDDYFASERRIDTSKGELFDAKLNVTNLKLHVKNTSIERLHLHQNPTETRVIYCVKRAARVFIATLGTHGGKIWLYSLDDGFPDSGERLGYIASARTVIPHSVICSADLPIQRNVVAGSQGDGITLQQHDGDDDDNSFIQVEAPNRRLTLRHGIHLDSGSTFPLYRTKEHILPGTVTKLSNKFEYGSNVGSRDVHEEGMSEYFPGSMKKIDTKAKASVESLSGLIKDGYDVIFDSRKLNGFIVQKEGTVWLFKEQGGLYMYARGSSCAK